MLSGAAFAAAGAGPTRLYQGAVWQDLNGNATRDVADQVFAGVTVFEDANQNARLDDGEVSTTTNAQGQYELQFAVDEPGQIVMRTLDVVLPAGFAKDEGSTVIGGGSTGAPVEEDIQIGSPTRDFAGTVWRDSNGNNLLDAGDAGVGGVTVFDDVNSNGRFDSGEASVTTDADGYYDLRVSVNQWHRPSVAPPAGLANNTALVSIGSMRVRVGSTPVLRDFRIGASPTLSGTLFNDLNLNGVQDAGEGGMAGVSVFASRSGGATMSAGDDSATTDSDGYFVFSAVDPGFVLLGANLPDGWSTMARETSLPMGIDAQPYVLNLPAYQSHTVSGVVFADTNLNGVRDAGENGVANIGVRVPGIGRPLPDLGQAGAATVLSPYKYARLETDTAADGMFTLAGVPLNAAALTADLTGYVQTSPAPDSSASTVDFGIAARPAGAQGISIIRGTVFDDANDNGVMDSGEAPLAGILVSYRPVIASQPGVASSDPRHYACTTSDSSGRYEIGNVAAGKFILDIGTLGRSGATAELTLGSREIRAIDMATRPHAVVSGTVVVDTNHNGVADPSEERLDNIVVYLDLDKDGQRDAGEPGRYTDVNGHYVFDGVPNCAYTVRVVSQDGLYLQSPPPSGVAQAQVMTEYPPLLVATRTELQGTVFFDKDNNGRRTQRDQLLAGVRVFVDQNNNGVLDKGESATRTDSKGNYSFVGLPAGRRFIRVILPKGFALAKTWTKTSPVTLQYRSRANKEFGLKRVVKK